MLSLFIVILLLSWLVIFIWEFSCIIDSGTESGITKFGVFKSYLELFSKFFIPWEKVLGFILYLTFSVLFLCFT